MGLKEVELRPSTPLPLPLRRPITSFQGVPLGLPNPNSKNGDGLGWNRLAPAGTPEESPLELRGQKIRGEKQWFYALLTS